jgi:hypothetical protein
MQPNAGDDVPERPLQIALYEMFATVAGPAELSASGPRCLETLAENLLRAGYAPDREVVLYRAGENIGRTTVAAAAQQES